MERDDVKGKGYGWVGFEGVMESRRTSLGRSALLSGAVCMTRLRVHRMGMALEEHGQQRDVPDISARGFTSLHSTRTESCVARYSGTTL